VEVAEIASLRRRCLASLIDGVVTVTPVVLVAGGGVWLYLWYDHRRSGSDAAKGPDISPSDGRMAAFRRFGESRRWQIALSVGAVPIEVRMRNWRSPGMRLMGLLRADVRTGGPVTVRSLLVRKAVVTAWQDLYLPALWSERNQTLPDRLAGIVVIRD